MCGRGSLTKTETELEKRFDATFYSEDLERYNRLPNFNVAPTHMHPIITNKEPTRIQYFRWGLVPFWAKDIKIGYKMINSRIETILEKAAFRNALKNRRCLVPFDGFYEWKKNKNGKVPYRIQIKDVPVFTMAGIWEKWKDPNGDFVFSFSLITQKANAAMAPIHDRMPAIFRKEEERYWLDDALSPQEALSLIQPLPDECFHFYPVSNRVGKVAENDENLLEEVPLDLEENDDKQGRLF